MARKHEYLLRVMARNNNRRPREFTVEEQGSIRFALDEIANLRAECKRLRRAMEHAQWIIGKGRCTCAESEGAMRVLDAALAAPATPAADAGERSKDGIQK